MSRTTLYRRLKAEGTSFQALLDEVRSTLAAQLLQQPGRSISEVAYNLGFSEPAAFHRAYRRWYGEAPSAARAREGSHP